MPRRHSKYAPVSVSVSLLSRPVPHHLSLSLALFSVSVSLLAIGQHILFSVSGFFFRFESANLFFSGKFLSNCVSHSFFLFLSLFLFFLFYFLFSYFLSPQNEYFPKTRLTFFPTKVKQENTMKT